MCAQNPVHFRIHSHNEIQDIQKGIDYTVATTYNNIKTVVYRIRDTVQKYRPWNMQVESNLVRGCLLNDNAYSSATDMLQSMDSALAYWSRSPQPSLTSHRMNYNPYNYADVAHLLDSSGLTPPRTNVGGYLYKTPTGLTQQPTIGHNGRMALRETRLHLTLTPTTLWEAERPDMWLTLMLLVCGVLPEPTALPLAITTPQGLLILATAAKMVNRRHH